ncbi:MAG: hypothetical protein AAFZ80_02005 [Cyanobacteria bacterium P01_A01_bin.105]
MAEPIISPLPAAPAQPAVHQSILLHQAAVEFHQEIAARQAFADYCRWYDETAQQNQIDLAAMRHEAEILGWFRGRERH